MSISLPDSVMATMASIFDSSSLRTPLVVVAAALMFGVGCSLTLELDECDDDADCADLGTGWTCTGSNLCQPPDGSAECDSNSDCEEEQGQDWTCSDDGTCEPPAGAISCDDDGDCPDGQECNDLDLCQLTADDLVEPPCELTAGPIEDDDAFIVGVLLPFTGSEASFGEALFNGITLALADFNAIGGIDGRPVAVLGCDTEGQNQQALDGAHRLAELDIEAVVGPDWSDQTLEVATEVTIDNEMTQVSPSATAAELTGLDDNGLVWRTAPSDAVQGHALGELVNYALDERPHYAGIDTSNIPDESSLAILRRGNDPYARGLREAITERLPTDLLDDSDRFYLDSYPNEAAGENVAYAEVAASLITETVDDGKGPDVIAIIGASEAWLLAEQLEDEFDNPPLFIFADAARVPTYTDETPSSLEGRIWGTAPRNIGELDYQPYTSFRLRYEENFDDDPEEMQFVPNAFDALYVIGLGAAAGGFTGPEISDGMTRISDGETYLPTATNVQPAMSALAAGDSINFDGASGPLNFDEHGDPEPTPTALWCFDDGGLPEEGVILDAQLEFTPLICGGSADECDEHDECTDHPDNSDPFCQDGQCLFSCHEGYDACGGQCIDFDTDDDHCGGCDDACGDDQWCAEGSCAECTSDAECDDNEVCDDGICTAECTTADDCDGELVCADDGQCTQCNDGGDCDEDHDCVDGICVDESALCGEQLCDAGYVCDNDECVPE